MPLPLLPNRMLYVAGLLLTQAEIVSSRVFRMDVHSAFSKYGEYYMNFSVGNPPQTFRLQLDTGSSDTAMPQLGCESCVRHAERRYNPGKSRSARNVDCRMGEAMNFSCSPCHGGQCAYSISYEDESGYSAVLWMEDAGWLTTSGSTITVQKTAIGGIYSDHKRNPTQPPFVDGIMGLAYRSIANSGAPTPLDRLVADNDDVDDVFALCLNSKLSKRRPGGSLVVGSPAGNSFYSQTKGIQWTPLLEKTYYPVNMLGLKVGGVKLNTPPAVFNRGGAIIDSGSTTFSLPRTAFDAFRDQLLTACRTKEHKLVGICVDSKGNKIEPGRGMFSGLCYSLTQEDINAFPPLTVLLENAKLSLSPRIYLRPSLCEDKKQVTLGIDSGPVEEGTILGDVFMEHFLTVFDRANSRIGFAPANDHC